MNMSGTSATSTSILERFQFISNPLHSKESDSTPDQLNGWYIQLESESDASDADDHADDRESVLSLQARETDIAKDTSDTDSYSSYVESIQEVALEGLEYDVMTDAEVAERPLESAYEDSSGGSDNIITTEIIRIVVDDVDKGFADSEESSFGSTDSEINLSDFWKCMNCHNQNNNPMFRFCEKCFKARKNYFPPRPKRKKNLKRTRKTSSESGLHELEMPASKRFALSRNDFPISSSQESFRESKVVQPIVKSLSDPEVCFDSNGNSCSQSSETGISSGIESSQTSSFNDLPNTLVRQSKSFEDGLCITCSAEPKTGVFVHSRTAHICCCYKCARKVWELTKRCPICNCKVSKVLKAFVF